MTRVLELKRQRVLLDDRELPAAPMAMPEQTLERRRAGGGLLFMPLFRWLVWK